MAKLQNLIKLPILHCCRPLHTSYACTGESRIMRKILTGAAPKKKHKYIDTPILPNPSSFSKGANEGQHSGSSKRVAVLNKLFMRYITDLMATGQCSTEFLGHGLEINMVKVSPDFKEVNIFWVARGTDNDEILEDILQKNVGALRHELAQLKLVGVIPKLRFVKDKKYAQLMEVEQLLARADFGDDYVPGQPYLKLKTELEINTSLPPNIKEKVQKLEQEHPEDYEEPLPPMSQSVFGLNHLDIMERVQKATKKSKAPHRLNIAEADDPVLPKTINEHPVEFTSPREQREAFRQFLHQREVLKSKMQKGEKNYRPELDYLIEQWETNQDKSSHPTLGVREDDIDYIDEEHSGIK